VLRIVYDRSATKDLDRIPAAVAALIRRKVAQLATTPADLANRTRRLTGRPESRLRVGDWRVLYEIEGGTLHVRRVAHRREVYR
jgi:mRNA interferase RelE/StbE